MGFFKKLFSMPSDSIYAPVAGEAVPISEVSDPTFGQEILGKGIAIRPTDGKVYAPCDATVDMMFETGHAVSLIADCGAEILIHIGLDTVNLKGQHYTVHAQNGDKVKKGQLLIAFDREAVAAAGYDTITPVVVCNSAEYTAFRTYTGTVTTQSVILELAK
jgi:PTS system beta-glucosides-specific IIC component